MQLYNIQTQMTRGFGNTLFIVETIKKKLGTLYIIRLETINLLHLNLNKIVGVLCIKINKDNRNNLGI